MLFSAGIMHLSETAGSDDLATYRSMYTDPLVGWNYMLYTYQFAWVGIINILNKLGISFNLFILLVFTLSSYEMIRQCNTSWNYSSIYMAIPFVIPWNGSLYLFTTPRMMLSYILIKRLSHSNSLRGKIFVFMFAFFVHSSFTVIYTLGTFVSRKGRGILLNPRSAMIYQKRSIWILMCICMLVVAYLSINPYLLNSISHYDDLASTVEHQNIKVSLTIISILALCYTNNNLTSKWLGFLIVSAILWFLLPSAANRLFNFVYVLIIPIIFVSFLSRIKNDNPPVQLK